MRRRTRQRRLVAGLIVAVLVIAAVVVVIVRNGGKSPAPATKSVAALSQNGLTTLAGALRRPVYWEGPRAATTYEVTQISDGRIFVRYLPPGVKAGSPRAYPFVATLPFPNAFPATYAVAHKAGAIRIPLTPNAVAFYSPKLPTNAWIAFKGSNYQIEVYDPNPARIRALIAEDVIQPISASAPGAVTASARTAASLHELTALPSHLGHPVYWVGTQPGTKYELTLTPTGGVFIRYLPRSARIGTSKPYLFVASLPVQNAFAATSAAAARPTSVKIPAPDGAVAFHSKALPTNVYVAFPGASYQIELYSPDASQVQALVRSGQVHALSSS